MASVEALREFINGRLSAAAAEIFSVFLPTIVQHQEEIQAQQRLLQICRREPTKSQRRDDPQQHFYREEQFLKKQEHSSLSQEETHPQEIKEEQEEPHPPEIKEEQEEPHPPEIKEEQEEPHPPLIKEEQEEPQPPDTTGEQDELELPQIEAVLLAVTLETDTVLVTAIGERSEQGENLVSHNSVREFINERLTAAAREVFTVFQQTIVQYQEEIHAQRRLLDITLNPQVKLRRIGFTHQADDPRTTNSYSNNDGNEYRTHVANCSPQASDEMDIQDSADSNDPWSVDNALMDSTYHAEDDISVCEMDMEPQVSLPLDMSETEDDDDKSTEADGEVTKEVILKKSVLKSGKKMDEKVLDSSFSSIQVKMSSNPPDQRVYDKRNYCLYCERPFAKITRHLMQKHHDQVEVAKALAHRQGSTMRNLLLSKIKNQGNYNHNCSVLSSGKGKIIPKRQPTYVSSATDYLPCKFCYAMYVKTDLWRHYKRCKLNPKQDGPVKRKVQTSSSFLLPMDHPISSGLQKILEEMTDDAVTQLVKSDQLIRSLGERMFLKNGEVGRHRADIKNKMRELARLVLVARDLSKDIVSLKDLINPAKFNIVLEAVKKMTGFDHLTNRFAVPSTALKLRHSLVKVSFILQGDALRQEDDIVKARAEHFSKLIELEWTNHVSSNALKPMYQEKMEQSPNAASC